ncbi:hypothetical protein [Caldisericum sp.]|uniref:hypothetical protein n=1 Tax=Caldisericum sp. TaxID=2499687 RepID=UPI003D0DC25B
MDGLNPREMGFIQSLVMIDVVIDNLAMLEQDWENMDNLDIIRSIAGLYHCINWVRKKEFPHSDSYFPEFVEIDIREVEQTAERYRNLEWKIFDVIFEYIYDLRKVWTAEQFKMINYFIMVLDYILSHGMGYIWWDMVKGKKE